LIFSGSLFAVILIYLDRTNLSSAILFFFLGIISGEVLTQLVAIAEKLDWIIRLMKKGGEITEE
jgi:hypothetical protein